MNTLSKLLLFLILILPIFSCSNNEKSNKLQHSKTEKSFIDRVIAIDDSIGKIRNHHCETISLSETIKIYTSGIEEINFSDCPDEFTNAFKSHKNAWNAMLKITDQYPDLRAEMHDLFDILEDGKDKDTFRPLLDSIWSTWSAIEKSM